MDRSRSQERKGYDKASESFKSYLEKKWGKLTGILYTFGRFDIVITAELPSDEVAMSVSLSTGGFGKCAYYNH